MKLELPWPPSANTYWRRAGRIMYVSEKAKQYRIDVAAAIFADGKPKQFAGPVSFKVRLHPPNRLRRDLDNSLKVLIDAVAKAGVLGDDYQIKHIEATMLGVVADGHATVEIEPLQEAA